MAICVGCGLTIDGSGLLTVEKRPNGGLDCTNTGAADDGMFLAAFVGDTSTVDMSGTGTGASPLSAAVKISNTDCNALSVVGTGLYVPCSDGVVGVLEQTSPQNVGAGQFMAAIASYNYLNDNAFNSIHICNPTCCSVQGFVAVTVGDTYLIADVNFLGNAHLRVNIDNAGFTTVSPDSQRIFHNVGNAAQRMDADNIGTTLFVDIAPGACHDFQWDLQFDASSGTANLHTLSAGPKFYTHWMFTHTNCCDHIG